MEPSDFIDKGPMILAGLSFFGDPFASSKDWTQENEIGKLWQRFTEYLAHSGEQISKYAEAGIAYEIHFEDEETAVTGFREVFVGIEIPHLEITPLRMLVKYLPAATYAIFVLEGQQIVSDWPRQIYGEWLPKSGYREAHPFTAQKYDKRFKGTDQIKKSVIEVYVPVEKS